MNKTYKDLPPQEEVELKLWLDFFEDSVKNAYLQMNRWKDLRSGWDLQMFFVAITFIDDAANGLKRFLSNDDEIWAILSGFRKEFEAHNLRGLRNEIVHPKNLFKWQDKKGNSLPTSPLLILGAYHVDKDEYYFGTHRIKLSEVFEFLETMAIAIKKVLENRLEQF